MGFPIALPVPPTPSGTHLNLCALLSQMGKHHEALEHVQRALELLEAMGGAGDRVRHRTAFALSSRAAEASAGGLLVLPKQVQYILGFRRVGRAVAWPATRMLDETQRSDEPALGLRELGGHRAHVRVTAEAAD